MIIRKIIFYLILILFPLNQQLHFRDFPTIDGIVLDYLIIKVSISQILIFLLTLFSIPQILKFLTGFKFNLNSSSYIFLLFLFLTLFYSIFTSHYLLLSFLDTLYFLLLFLNVFVLKDLFSTKEKRFLLISLCVWVVLLTFLGVAQFVKQSSVFNNYQLFGEFPYSDQNYHIKQDSYFLGDLIPAYSIFSHSNIFGGYLLTLLMFIFLNFDFKNSAKISKFMIMVVFLIGLLGIFLAGSLVVLLGLVVFLFSYYLNLSKNIFWIWYLVLLFLILSLSPLNSNFNSDNSIYRRLYQTELSLKYFVTNPTNFLLGFGYMNYFSEVSLDLYKFENVRFLQPPHSIVLLIIWNYGFFFLLLLGGGVDFLFKKIHPATPLLSTLLFLGLFYHYLLTNHQFKILLFLIISSFIFQPNRIII